MRAIKTEHSLEQTVYHNSPHGWIHAALRCINHNLSVNTNERGHALLDNNTAAEGAPEHTTAAVKHTAAHRWAHHPALSIESRLRIILDTLP